MLLHKNHNATWVHIASFWKEAVLYWLRSISRDLIWGKWNRKMNWHFYCICLNFSRETPSFWQVYITQQSTLQLHCYAYPTAPSERHRNYRPAECDDRLRDWRRLFPCPPGLLRSLMPSSCKLCDGRKYDTFHGDWKCKQGLRPWKRGVCVHWNEQQTANGELLISKESACAIRGYLCHG